MPRTRTKFIWPPPNSKFAGESSSSGTNATTTNEQQAPSKKPRLDLPSNATNADTNTFAAAANEHRMSHREDNNSPASHDSRRESRQSSQQTKTGSQPLLEWDSTSNGAPPSMQAIIAAYSQIPMDTQIKRYQDWRRHGSVHDDYCMMCQRPLPQNLVPCYTCRRSFHDVCLPPGSLYDDKSQWYCTICVRRNWHVEPPTVTPPESPRQSPQQESTQHTSAAVAMKAMTDKGLTSHKSPSETGAQDSQALSILAEISRSMSSNHGLNDGRISYASPSPAPKPPAHLGALSSTRHGDSGMPSPSTQSFSMLDSHARKSRFATLSSEVDSALWVLYRELESATSLRQQISELQAEIVKLRQDVSIRDNQIILSQRAAQAVHISQAEVDRLRAQAAKADSTAREVESLRARNEGLEKELKDARAECAQKDEALNEWKGKLARLIDT